MPKSSDIDQAFLRAAISHQKAGRSAEAERMFREIIAEDSKNAVALHAMGTLMLHGGRVDEAIDWLRRSIKVSRKDAAAHYNLGNAWSEKGKFGQAVECYREAVRLKPGYIEARINLGNAFQMDGKLDESVETFRQALAVKPDMPLIHYNLGNVLYWRAELDQAMECFRRAIALQHDYTAANGNLLFLTNFHAGYDAKTIYADHVAWSQREAEPLKNEWRAHGNGRDGERRLRVGYVSPDFREQAEAYFVVPLLEAHDHEHFEIHLYSSVERPDALTERHRKAADQWHEVGKLSDSQLAQKIRADGIDILVDLTMHMANNRALTFARKPAPVQVAWLAYPGTTGMSAMDYRITDAWMDPVGGEGEGGEGQDGGGDESVYTEKSIRLPDCWCCYHPLTDEPQINDLPASKGQSITFGALNSFHKVNEGILSLWGKAMMALPQSRLLMLAPQGSARERVTAFMSKQGIEAKRIEFTGMRPRAEYLRLYHKIDIGLDPLPYNGITTTLDALWMGVPVLSRVGTRASGRAGLAMLRALGYPDLAAQSDEAFVDKAKQLASDIPALAARRQGLRAKLQASPLMDAPRFARHMEAAYRQMWRNWCASGN